MIRAMLQSYSPWYFNYQSASPSSISFLEVCEIDRDGKDDEEKEVVVIDRYPLTFSSSPLYSTTTTTTLSSSSSPSIPRCEASLSVKLGDHFKMLHTGERTQLMQGRQYIFQVDKPKHGTHLRVVYQDSLPYERINVNSNSFVLHENLEITSNYDLRWHPVGSLMPLSPSPPSTCSITPAHTSKVSFAWVPKIRFQKPKGSKNPHLGRLLIELREGDDLLRSYHCTVSIRNAVSSYLLEYDNETERESTQGDRDAGPRFSSIHSRHSLSVDAKDTETKKYSSLGNEKRLRFLPDRVYQFSVSDPSPNLSILIQTNQSRTKRSGTHPSPQQREHKEVSLNDDGHYLVPLQLDTNYRIRWVPEVVGVSLGNSSLRSFSSSSSSSSGSPLKTTVETQVEEEEASIVTETDFTQSIRDSTVTRRDSYETSQDSKETKMTKKRSTTTTPTGICVTEDIEKVCSNPDSPLSLSTVATFSLPNTKKRRFASVRSSPTKVKVSSENTAPPEELFHPFPPTTHPHRVQVIHTMERKVESCDLSTPNVQWEKFLYSSCMRCFTLQPTMIRVVCCRSLLCGSCLISALKDEFCDKTKAEFDIRCSKCSVDIELTKAELIHCTVTPFLSLIRYDPCIDCCFCKQSFLLKLLSTTTTKPPLFLSFCLYFFPPHSL